MLKSAQGIGDCAFLMNELLWIHRTGRSMKWWWFGLSWTLYGKEKEIFVS